MSAPRRLLVLRGGALGDFILTLPAVAALRAAFPSASLALAGPPALGALALAHAGVDEFWSLEDRGLAGFFHPTGTLDPVWRARFAAADLILSHLHDPQGVFHGRLARITGARLLRGPHRPDETAPGHAMDQLLAPLRRAGIPAAGPPRLLNLPEPGARRFLAIHPGSGGRSKNWPEARWREWLGLRAGSSEWPALLIGGEAEEGRAGRLAAALPPGRARVVEGRPLTEVVEALADAVGFVGHDSGVAHLAAAAGLPGLALWGPSNARVWMPPSPVWARLETAGGLETLAADAVDEEVARRWPEWLKARKDNRSNP